MTFKEFLEMTSTGDIATFSRMVIPSVTRSWMPTVAFDMEVPQHKRKKKKVHQQPQVKE
jgi:hypothetical protein